MVVGFAQFFFQQIGLRQQVLAIWLGLHRNVGIGGGITQLSAYNVSQERVQNGQQKALMHATWYPRFLSVLSSCQRRKSNRSTSCCAFFLRLASTVNLRFKLAHASIFIYRRKRCPTLWYITYIFPLGCRITSNFHKYCWVGPWNSTVAEVVSWTVWRCANYYIKRAGPHIVVACSASTTCPPCKTCP